MFAIANVIFSQNLPFRISFNRSASPYGNIDHSRSASPYGNIDHSRSASPYGNIDHNRSASPYGNIDHNRSASPYGNIDHSRSASPYGNIDHNRSASPCGNIDHSRSASPYGHIDHNRSASPTATSTTALHFAQQSRFNSSAENFSYFFKKALDKYPKTVYNVYCYLGVAQIGSALPWGGRGRRFKSCHSDQLKTA